MYFRIAIVLCVATASLFGQSPAAFPADPGPSQSLPAGFVTPVYVHTPLFNVQSAVSLLASMVIGPGGHLYFTETVGSGCNAANATLIYRVAMNGNAPVQPVAISPFSTVPVDAHVLAYDPLTDALYKGGTCGQTTLLYRIPASGVPQALNASNPLNADIITQAAVAMTLANDPVTQNWGGMLDANGHANALMYFPPGVIPSGITIQFGFALGNPEYSSNSAWIHVIP